MSRIEARPRAALAAFPLDEQDLAEHGHGDPHRVGPRRAVGRAEAVAGAPALTAAAAGAVGR